jgi:carboxypeptidase A1
MSSYQNPSFFTIETNPVFIQIVVVSSDFHAYSQLWMHPYGYDCSLGPKDTVIQAGKDAAKALKAVHGKTFAVGSICNIIYEASGSSVDWAYDLANVTYPYGVELRDQGQYGFLLPAKQILPSGEETFASIVALAQRIIKDSA